MENLVFERNYSDTFKEIPDDSQFDNVLLQALSDGFLTSYAEALNAVPKVIIPEYQANYEYVLQICDDLAETWGGSVRGEISYERWDATIDMVVPYVDFTSPKDLQNLREIAERSHGVTIKSVDDGILIHIYNRYFEDCITDEKRKQIAFECVLNDKKLSEMLGLSKELPPELQPVVVYLNTLLNTIEKDTSKDREEIINEFLFRLLKSDWPGSIFDTIKNVGQEMLDEYGLQ